MSIGTPIIEALGGPAQMIGTIGEAPANLALALGANGIDMIQAAPAAESVASVAREQSFQSLIATPPKGPGLG